MLKLIHAGCLAACFLLPTAASAFGAGGHMTVGSIADQLIAGTPAARQVRRILGTNLRTAAVWADCAKGVSGKPLKYSGDGKYPECAVYENDASKAQMVAFVKRNLTNCLPPAGAEECHKQYHYTDVAIQRDGYAKTYVGTSDHDVVSAIAAAITVLQGGKSPAPFAISGRREALRLLAHYVGDIHQPLHVAAVYLDADGLVVDPDQGQFDPRTETRGGNDLTHGSRRLHGEWDDIGPALNADGLADGVLADARAVAPMAGELQAWPAAWAGESLAAGKEAFKDLQYSRADAAGHYQVTVPAGYSALKARIQREQVIKAGARLAQVLTRLWP